MMKVKYFYSEPKLNGYHFDQRTDFKYGVEITFFDESNNWYDAWREFLIPLVVMITEIYDIDPSRYEFLMETECHMYRILFKDEEDQAGFKLLYPGEWDPDPVWIIEDE